MMNTGIGSLILILHTRVLSSHTEVLSRPLTTAPRSKPLQHHLHGQLAAAPTLGALALSAGATQAERREDGGKRTPNSSKRHRF